MSFQMYRDQASEHVFIRTTRVADQLVEDLLTYHQLPSYLISRDSFSQIIKKFSCVLSCCLKSLVVVVGLCLKKEDIKYSKKNPWIYIC